MSPQRISLVNFLLLLHLTQQVTALNGMEHPCLLHGKDRIPSASGPFVNFLILVACVLLGGLMISIIFKLAKRFAGEQHARDGEGLLRNFGGQAERALRDWNIRGKRGGVGW